MTAPQKPEPNWQSIDDLAELTTAQPDGIYADGLPAPRRHWATVSIWLAISMSVLDSSLANIALPTIARDLDARPSAVIWVVSSYQIAITMALLTIAALGDILGHRRVYLSGLALFVAASVGSAISTSLTELTVARFAQGIGAAGLMGLHGAMVRFTYPARLLGRGIGWNATIIATFSAAGPGVAALILSVADWRWLYAVNVPFGLMAIAIGWRALPDTPRGSHRFDLISALLCAAAFGPFFAGASVLANGDLSAGAFALISVGVVALILLARRANGQSNPLLPLDLLRIPMLRLSYLTSSFGFAAQTAMLIALPFYLERRFGFDHVMIGLLIIPMPATLAIAAPLAGHFVDRVGAALMCGIGMAVFAIGLLLLLMPTSAPQGVIIAAMIMCGAGFGMFQTPNNRTIVSLTPRARVGSGGGMMATARLLGQTSAGVLVALIFHLVGGGAPAPLIMAAAFALLAALISLGRARVDDPRAA